MKRRTIFTIGTILLICFTLWTCKKENIVCTNDKTFCVLVNDQNFDATGPLFDDFLATLNKDDQDKNLEELKDWLECKSCVEKAKILCNSCIETGPPQSELIVYFISNGKTIKKTLDILMGDPLTFRRYH